MGGRGSKNCWFWDDIVYGRPLYAVWKSLDVLLLSQTVYCLRLYGWMLINKKALFWYLDWFFSSWNEEEMVFCYQNCSDLLWEKIVLVIEKNFWNSRLKAENFQNFWNHFNNLFKQWKVRTIFGNRMLF